MLNFNVETHGDIRFCTICRRYIVMKANSPQQVPTPFTALETHCDIRFCSIYRRYAINDSELPAGRSKWHPPLAFT